MFEQFIQIDEIKFMVHMSTITPENAVGSSTLSYGDYLCTINLEHTPGVTILQLATS